MNIPKGLFDTDEVLEVDYDNLYIPLGELKKRAGISDANLRKLEVEITGKGVYFWRLVFQMWKSYKTLETALGEVPKTGEDDPVAAEATRIQLELMHEKLIALRIKNQEALAELIAKEEAKDRTLNSLQLIGDMVQTVIKTCSKTITEFFTVFTEEQRALILKNPGHLVTVERAKVESILSREYMKVLETLEETSVEFVEWKDEDNSRSIMRTKLNKQYSDAEKSERTATEIADSLKKHKPLSVKGFSSLLSEDD
jgi:hypothetical protein